jgi:hypothetical protein
MVQFASWVSKYLPLEISYFWTRGSTFFHLPNGGKYQKHTKVVTNRLPVAASNHNDFGLGLRKCFLGDGGELYDVLLTNLVGNISTAISVPKYSQQFLANMRTPQKK